MLKTSPMVVAVLSDALRLAKNAPQLRALRVLYRRARALQRALRDRIFVEPRHPPLEELRRLDPKLPVGVVIEPTTACNAKCVFCPVSQRGDDFKVTHLDGTVLDRLLEELRTWPATMSGYVQMVGLGEPTVARNFAKNLKRLREAIPKRFTITLNTNGTTLHSDKVRDAIIGVVDTLTISINGYDETSYQTLNGIPGFRETLEKTVAFLDRKNSIDGYRMPSTRVQLMRTIYENASALRDFEARLRPVLGEADAIETRALESLAGVEESVDKLQTAADRERKAAIDEVNIPCFQVWYNAYITAEGDVYPCCIVGNVDGREARKDTGLLLGNVQDTPLSSIWNGAERKEIMRQHIENEKLPFCQRCSIVTLYDMNHWRRVKTHAKDVGAFEPIAPPRKRLPIVA